MHQSTKYQATPWKLALALLVAAFFGGMATTMTIAANRVAPVTDPDYYQKGLNYGRTASGSHNAGQGWSLAASLVEGELQVRVTDQTGAPVSGGELTFQPKLTETGSGPLPEAALALRESDPGVYRAPRPALRQGDLRGMLLFAKGGATASRKLVLIN